MSTIKAPQDITQASEPSDQQFTDWFDEYISSLRVDNMMIQTKTASDETRKFYTHVVNKDIDAISTHVRSLTTRLFVQKVIIDYLEQLAKYKRMPQKLAFDLSDAKIMVWAQIPDEDEATEDALILSEAETNTHFSDNGFYVCSTIVEESDNLEVPPHYHSVKLDGRISVSH